MHVFLALESLYRKQVFIFNCHYFYGNAMFGNCEIDDESMTQLANKIENEALFENCEMDDATLSQFLARYDTSFDLGVI